MRINKGQNIDNRLEAISTDCPYEPKVIGLFCFKTEKAAREMELSLHHRFRKFNARLEWFNKKMVLFYLRKDGKLF